LEEGVFHALSRQYLETVLLEIYEDPDADVTGSNENKRNKSPTIYGTGAATTANETQNADSDTPSDLEKESSAGLTSLGVLRTSRRLLEVFSFSISYPKASGPEISLSRASPANGSSPAQCSRQSIKHNTSEVLRLLVELSSTLQPLPDNRVISIKLLYMPSTPTDYEPPMFGAAGEDSMNCWFENRYFVVHLTLTLCLCLIFYNPTNSQ
jgi:hypothetical protein